jgi:hypothetical protein
MPVSIQTAHVAAGLRKRGSVPLASALFSLVALWLISSPASAQGTSSPSVQSGEIRTLPTGDSDRIQQSTVGNARLASAKNPASEEACLLPPLNLTPAPLVSAPQLQVPSNARKEYQRACAALKEKKGANAEKHLRIAVEDYPKYSAAWVTLGQLLVSQQKTQEGRSACSQAATVDSSYVPAYLCLAHVAAREHDWGEALSLSNRAIEIDPGNNAVAYEYQAAANLNLHNLADAEKSGLHAAEIDKIHREPRVHFVLAQIYEAKHEPANEAAQLREYLKYADNPDDVAMAREYLADLEKQAQK